MRNKKFDWLRIGGPLPLRILAYALMFFAMAFVAVTFAGLILSVPGFVIKPILDMEHYRRVREVPLTVTATVTDYGTDEDEDGTTYCSYITYTVNGVQYTNAPYERKSSESDLTPMGTQVQVQVSPEDPSRQIGELRRSWVMLLVLMPMVTGCLSVGCEAIYKRKIPREVPAVPDGQTLQGHLKRTVCGRKLRPFCLFTGIGMLLLHLRYPDVFTLWALILAAVCGLLWLWCLICTVRDYRRITREEYEVRRDVLAEKYESTDSEGGTQYYLRYRSNGEIWSKSVSQWRYDRAKRGETVIAVYLPGRKEPLLHYETK